MATSTYEPNVLVTLTSGGVNKTLNISSIFVTSVSDNSDGGSTLNLADGTTIVVTESVADIDALVTAAGGTVVT